MTTPLRLTSLTLLLVLAACASEPQPKFADPTNPTPTTTPPTPSTTTPPTTTQPTETPEAFIRRFTKVEFKMQNTGDTRLYRTLWLPSCDLCEGLANNIDEVYAAGGWVKVGQGKVISLRRLKKRNGSLTFRMSVWTPTTRISIGGEVKTLPAGEDGYIASITQQSDQWIVVRFEPTP